MAMNREEMALLEEAGERLGEAVRKAFAPTQAPKLSNMVALALRTLAAQVEEGLYETLEVKWDGKEILRVEGRATATLSYLTLPLTIASDPERLDRRASHVLKGRELQPGDLKTEAGKMVLAAAKAQGLDPYLGIPAAKEYAEYAAKVEAARGGRPVLEVLEQEAAKVGAESIRRGEDERILDALQATYGTRPALEGENPCGEMGRLPRQEGANLMPPFARCVEDAPPEPVACTCHITKSFRRHSPLCPVTLANAPPSVPGWEKNVR